MRILQPTQPLGIFDSGIGGLTVARAVMAQLPFESIIYFGDTMHLPYGDKSVATVQSYAKKIVDFLLTQEVKLILLACNSASAVAYAMLQEYLGTQPLLVNVIDPVVEFLGKNFATQRVGLIGTRLTVDSQVYQQKVASLGVPLTLTAVATPLLVPIIEEGFFTHKIVDLVLAEYLSHAELQNIEALVLGCTHYPLIARNIAAFYNNSVKLIDAATVAAQAVAAQLRQQDLLAPPGVPSSQFYVSDYTESFARGAELFLGRKIRVESSDIFASG